MWVYLYFFQLAVISLGTKDLGTSCHGRYQKGSHRPGSQPAPPVLCGVPLAMPPLSSPLQDPRPSATTAFCFWTPFQPCWVTRCVPGLFFQVTKPTPVPRPGCVKGKACCPMASVDAGIITTGTLYHVCYETITIIIIKSTGIVIKNIRIPQKLHRRLN